MKKITLLLSILVTISCSDNSTTDELAKAASTELIPEKEMDIDSTTIIEEKSNMAVQENPLTLYTFPKVWYQLDQVEDEYIINEYCEATTPQIKITQEDSIWYVYVIYGQDGQRYKVIDFDAYEETRENFEIVYGSFVLENPDYPDMDVELYDYMWNKDQQFCRFEGFFQDPTMMVSEQNKDNYRIVKENCDYLK